MLRRYVNLNIVARLATLLLLTFVGWRFFSQLQSGFANFDQTLQLAFILCLVLYYLVQPRITQTYLAFWVAFLSTEQIWCVDNSSSIGWLVAIAIIARVTRTAAGPERNSATNILAALALLNLLRGLFDIYIGSVSFTAAFDSLVPFVALYFLVQTAPATGNSPEMKTALCLALILNAFYIFISRDNFEVVAGLPTLRTPLRCFSAAFGALLITALSGMPRDRGTPSFSTPFKDVASIAGHCFIPPFILLLLYSTYVGFASVDIQLPAARWILGTTRTPVSYALATQPHTVLGAFQYLISTQGLLGLIALLILIFVAVRRAAIKFDPILIAPALLASLIVFIIYPGCLLFDNVLYLAIFIRVSLSPEILTAPRRTRLDTHALRGFTVIMVGLFAFIALHACVALSRFAPLPAGTTGDHPNRDFVRIIVFHEDHQFFSHHGVDFSSLRESLRQNLQSASYVRGGSTITMQLAKIVYLTKEKTLGRKAQQIVLALLIEAFHTKEEILEAYLRSLDFGLEEGGLEFASHRYFGKPSRELTYTEALKLAISVPSPKLYNPSMPMNEHSWRLARKVTQGLERYGYLIDLDFMDAWRDQPVLPSASHD